MSKRAPERWRNSIVRYGEEPPDQLLAFPLNPKIHPRQQQDALAGAIGELGWLMPVVVNETTGHILDGHARVGLAISRDEPIVPVAYVQLTPEQEALAVATIDPVGALAATDKDVLDQLLREVSTGDAAVSQLLTDLAADNGLTYGEGGLLAGEAPEPEIDRAAELLAKWGVQRGDVWEIGRHRLVCGDCLDGAVLDRAVGDAAIAMVWADPPYGISIVATNEPVGGGEAHAIAIGGRPEKAPRTGAFSGNGRGLGSANGAKPFGDEPRRGTVGASNVVDVGKYLPVRGDDTTQTAEAAYRLCAERWPKAAHVWWGGNYYSHVLSPSSCWLVWNKVNGESNFADCELAWTNQKTATRMFTHRWNGMLRESERERRLHPTQKPAALAAWTFAKYTDEGAVIVDPFLGAGCSVVAAEQTGRSGIGIEWEPGYIAVTLERLAVMGLEPRRVEAGEGA
jgi:hypothetical protein